jgi:hypothetical protein
MMGTPCRRARSSAAANAGRWLSSYLPLWLSVNVCLNSNPSAAAKRGQGGLLGLQTQARPCLLSGRYPDVGYAELQRIYREARRGELEPYVAGRLTAILKEAPGDPRDRGPGAAVDSARTQGGSEEMKPSEQRVQRVEDKLGADDYQPLVLEVDRTIEHEDYAEAQRRSGTSLDSPGRPVVKIVLCGADADL